MTELVGVVLAAGVGRRLAPLTTLRPKALCPVNNKPLVDWALDRVVTHCADVAVNIHAHTQQMVGHLSGRGAHLSVEAPVALGTAGALGQLRGWIAGRPLLLTNADAWEMDGIGAIARLVDGWDGERPRLRCVYGVEPSFGPLRYVGTALLPWWLVSQLEADATGLYEVSWRRLYQEGRLDLAVDRGVAPIDCGTPAQYLQANLAASGGHSVVGPGAAVEGEIVRCVVWPDSRVKPHERLVDTIRAQHLTVSAATPAREE